MLLLHRGVREVHEQVVEVLRVLGVVLEGQTSVAWVEVDYPGGGGGHETIDSEVEFLASQEERVRDVPIAVQEPGKGGQMICRDQRSGNMMKVRPGEVESGIQ